MHSKQNLCRTNLKQVTLPKTAICKLISLVLGLLLQVFRVLFQLPAAQVGRVADKEVVKNGLLGSHGLLEQSLSFGM